MAGGILPAVEEVRPHLPISIQIEVETTTLEAVSYTHLDVYKRQLQACSEHEVTAERMVVDHLPDEGRAAHVDLSLIHISSQGRQS